VAESFGSVLKRLRAARSSVRDWYTPDGFRTTSVPLSQARLAELAGLDPAAVNKLERGLSHPRRTTVEQLADALGADQFDTEQLLISAGYWPWSDSLDPAALLSARHSGVAEG
jgi:transcriptional regulator with XRE-family HTH domain